MNNTIDNPVISTKQSISEFVMHRSKKTSIPEMIITGLKYVFLSLFALMCLYPIIWLVLNSFKNSDALFENPWGLPASLDFTNYIYAFVTGHLGQYFVNSIIIATSAVALGVLFSSMIAYAITRMQWKLSKFVMNIILLGMMIPIYATIIPLFSMFKVIGILNNLLAVIIPHIVFSFPIAIFILSGFFQTIPRDIEEAAVVDGCNILHIFFRIIFPISISSIVTVAVIVFIGIWNDLLLPQIFLTDPDKMTLPVGLLAFQGQYGTNYVGQIAAVVITIIPSVVVYILLHKNIMEGMIAGAVKG